MKAISGRGTIHIQWGKETGDKAQAAAASDDFQDPYASSPQVLVTWDALKSVYLATAENDENHYFGGVNPPEE